MDFMIDKINLTETIAVIGLVVALVASVILQYYDVTATIGSGLIGYIGGKNTGKN